MQVGDLYNPKKIFTGVFIPDSMARLPTAVLSPGSKLLFGRLSWHVNEDGDCFPSRDTLAEEIGVSLSSVKDYLRELEDQQFIIRVRSGPRANNYDFPWHPSLEASLRKRRTPECPSNVAPPEGVTDTRVPLDGHSGVFPSLLVTEDVTEDESTEPYIDLERTARIYKQAFKKPDKKQMAWASDKWAKYQPQVTESQVYRKIDKYKDSEWAKKQKWPQYPFSGFIETLKDYSVANSPTVPKASKYSPILSGGHKFDSVAIWNTVVMSGPPVGILSAQEQRRIDSLERDDPKLVENFQTIVERVEAIKSNLHSDWKDECEWFTYQWVVLNGNWGKVLRGGCKFLTRAKRSGSGRGESLGAKLSEKIRREGKF